MIAVARLISILVAACVLFAAAAEAQAGTPVRLRDQLVDSDGRVTLSDLFDGAGQAGNVLLSAGPAAGGNVVLDAARVQQVARMNGLDWANDHGFRRLVIKGEAAGASAAASGRTVPSLRSVAESEAFLDPSKKPAASRVFIETLPALRAVPIHERWVDVETTATDEIERAFYGQASVADVVRAIQSRVSAHLAGSERH